ncbi:MAG: hypothetical protein COT73_11330 [Bdellovibrio sp. CG10_big_fil_rev_8_21_14_0_10_47_8]|nr:MAG: hypothetical protein COT73_11330 [Bdellovibrio sp. CG10_big_fil_rev_8_21_14_0_10_47_8]
MEKPKLKVQITEYGRVVREVTFDSFPIVFGRSEECELRLANVDYISRVHGSIGIDQDEIIVTDLGSKNGFFYEGKPVRSLKNARLLSFEIEKMGFRLELDGQETSHSDETEIQIFETNAVKTTIVQPPSPSPILSMGDLPGAEVSSSSVPRSKGGTAGTGRSATGTGSKNTLQTKSKGDGPFKKPKIPSVKRGPLGASARPESDFEITRGSRTGSSYQAPPSDQVRFSIAPMPDIVKVAPDKAVVQGVVTWFDGIYDVRNFSRGEPLILGPNEEEPIYLPTTKRSMNFGQFGAKGATIRIPQKYMWGLYREKQEVPLAALVEEKNVISDGKSYQINLGLNEVISISMGAGMILHFRYVRAPQFYMQKSFIENKEEFKKAIIISGIIHLIVTAVALISAPKIQAPTVDNMPPRIAKLIVQPPPQLLATKPPPPPPPPPPEEPELEPPPKPEFAKPEPPKPKPVRQIVKKPVVVPKKPVKTHSVARKQTKPEPQVAEVKEPPKSAQQVQQEALANMLSSLPAPPSGGAKNAGAPIQISKSRISPNGIKVGGVAAVAGAVQANQPQGTAETGFKVASGGYVKNSTGGKTGKRGVGGSVVGTPQLSPKVGREQGISDDEVMKVVNKHLGEVQRCYERALFDDSSLVGRVEYEWEISAAGSVMSARVQRSEMARSDSLNNCVLGLFKKMKFPKAKNGQSTVAKIGFPFGRN